MDTKSGKEIGALYSTPGLDLLATTGAGGCRGFAVFGGLLYVVSGNSVYTVNASYSVNMIGSIATSSGPVSIIQNPTQLAIFDGYNGYLLPGGEPLQNGSGVITGAGTNYAVGDLIYLQNSDGQQNATAVVEVTAVSGGTITAFSVSQGGAFGPMLPSEFVQQSTTGSGEGFVMTSPGYDASVPIYMLTLPFPNPVSASYQDGFGLVNPANTQEMYQSNLNDLSIWQPLNFSSADAEPDFIQAMAELHEQQYIFKKLNTEVWINTGLAGFAFQRLSGVHIEMGCAAPFSVTQVGEALVWLAQNDQGLGTVQAISGYEPKKISTKAIDGVIQGYSTISDAIGYCYQQHGHVFYVLIFPTANATWVYDFSTELWHSRAAFANGQFSRHWSNCYASYNNQCIVGDYRNGNIYAYNQNTLTDNGTPNKWVRSWRALQKPVFTPTTYASLQIDMQTGIAVPDGTNPQVCLRWSDDGGHNWSNQRFLPAGKPGQTALRVIFKRLGSTKLNSGLDRIFELTSTDLMPVALIGADLN